MVVEVLDGMTDTAAGMNEGRTKLWDAHLTFPEGLIGCPQLRDFHLEALSEFMPIGRLVSEDVPGLSLIVADPRMWLPAYDLSSISHASSIHVAAEDVDLILVLLTISDVPAQSSVNFLGPLLVDLENGRGQQGIQSGTGFRPDEPLGDNLRVIRFKEGLIGCLDWREFLLLDVGQGGSLGMLVSLDEPFVALPVMDPVCILPSYAPELSRQDFDGLDAAASDDVHFRVIANVPADVEASTVNLLGPLAIHEASGNARQLLLAGGEYPADYPLVPGEKR